MAENVTTYEVVVDTQVNGTDKLEQAGQAAESTGGQFQRLQTQIRETQKQLQAAAEAGDKAKFNQLKGQLNDLQDKLEVTQKRSLEFKDALAAAPGPVGNVGKALQGLDATFKSFLANPIVLTLAAIVGAFVSLKEALSRTEEGQAKLNKISEGFTKILNGLFAIIEPVANMFADLIISLMENKSVMEGLSVAAGALSATFQVVFNVGKQLVGFIINNFVNAFKTLTDVAGGAGKVLKGVFTFDFDLIKEGVAQVGDGIKKGFQATVENVKSTAKGIGEGIQNGIKDGFTSGQKAFNEGTKRLTDAEKKALDERNKKAAEAAKKRAEQEKKDADERLKAIEEAGKVETEAYLSTLSQRDQEIFKRGQKLNEDLEKLEKARVAAVKEAQLKGVTDFSSIDDQYKSARVNAQQAFKNDEAAINKKFDEEEAKKAEEKALREKELSQKAFDEFKFSQENRLQELNNRYNREIALVNAQEQLLLCAEGLCTKDKENIIADANQKRVDLERKKYEDILALINEEEKRALEVVGLTEEQKTRIFLDAEAKRQAIRQQQRDDVVLGLETELANIGTSFDRRRELVAQKEAELLSQENLTENQRTAIKQQAAQERMAIDMEELDQRAEIQNAYLDLVGSFGNLLQQIAGKNKKVAIAGIIIEQAAAIGRIIANTAVANAKAVATFPITAGMPWVAINTASAALSIASTIASAAKSIQQINSAGNTTSAPTGGSTAGLRTATAPAGIAPTAPGIGGGMAVPQIIGTREATPGAQIAQTLSQRTGQPIRAYVVSGDITSQQALDRRTTRAATFSGGTGG